MPHATYLGCVTLGSIGHLREILPPLCSSDSGMVDKSDELVFSFQGCRTLYQLFCRVLRLGDIFFSHLAARNVEVEVSKAKEFVRSCACKVEVETDSLLGRDRSYTVVLAINGQYLAMAGFWKHSLMISKVWTVTSMYCHSYTHPNSCLLRSPDKSDAG